MGVNIAGKIFSFILFRIFLEKEVVIQTHFCGDSMQSRNPVGSTLNLTTGSRSTTFGIRVISTVQFNNLTLFILNYFFTLNNISTLKAYFSTRNQTEELLGGIFLKIFLFDIYFPGKWYLPTSSHRVFRVIFSLQPFHLALRVIINYHFKRLQNCHNPGSFEV